ncbi:peptidase E [Brachybacterium endophyticum]|uniref:Peptidase E n=1 Tax=Brachybacterium endophyticum TaxID=2182385 RepID=A0A2U2RHW8_9MICO|nr:peptidase E [Brachybacterium endophyticum]PWH05467.1 peptidase E [Brachybacterium endophyticum]
MTASQPTILATSGGYVPHPRLRFGFGPIMDLAIDLASERGRVDPTGTPRICNIATASGDDARFQRDTEEAAREAGFALHHLSLFPSPNVEDVEGYLRGFDVLWVNGGSVVNLLAVWRAHGLDRILHTLWREGVVLAGISAGSLCWHTGGVTDSFGPDLVPVTDGLGFLPWANGVHCDSERARLPLLRELVADGTLGTTLCTDDGVGLLYRAEQFIEAVTEREGAGARRLRRAPGHEAGTARVLEEELPVRQLAGAVPRGA